MDVIVRDGRHPTTGFWSSVELLLALSSARENSTASKLMNLTTYPSWGHMLTAGGTTFWESFDADQKTMSLNHWTHSACGEWLWRNVAGLNPDAEHPGYYQFTVGPQPTAEVNWCKAEYRSVLGPIKIEWHQLSDRFTLDIQIPPGSTAKVDFPYHTSRITESGIAIGNPTLQTLEVKSGQYHFTAFGPPNLASNLH